MLSADLQKYLLDYCEPETELLQQIDRETHLKVLMPRMLSGHYQGRVLSMISKMVQPKRILEIGTFTGYATLCLAEGLAAGGQLITLDINEELEERVRGYFAASEYGAQIEYIIGNAEVLIPTLQQVFDLVFIDADKKNNYTYFEQILDKVAKNGIIVVDNVLWSGKIVQGNEDKDSLTIRDFNAKIKEDARVEQLILPVRDGLLIMRKK